MEGDVHHFPFVSSCLFLNHWWFRTRYIAAYRGMLLEEKRRTFFQDVHDSLGSQLTDLVLLAKKMERSPTEVSENQIQKIKQLSESALQSLRTQVQEENQRELFQESLLDGLKLSIKKRYKLVGRGINLEWMSLGEDPIIKIKDPEMAHHILQIFKEITTNDLRHGEGTSTWKVDKTQDHLQFQFFAGFGQSHNKENTLQELRSNQNEFSEFGIGEQGLYQRIKSLNGYIKITDFPYQIDIKLPLGLFHL